MRELAFVPNLVKPPKPANSRQAPDSTAEINLKIWRVYPSGFAILELDIKLAQAFPLAPFLLRDSLLHHHELGRNCAL
jgi:hypothetical protein